jgi:hypothetical protein
MMKTRPKKTQRQLIAHSGKSHARTVREKFSEELACESEFSRRFPELGGGMPATCLAAAARAHSPKEPIVDWEGGELLFLVAVRRLCGKKAAHTQIFDCSKQN